jgi:hypothetical protein
VADSDHFGVTLLVQMLHGPGLESIKVAETGAKARKDWRGMTASSSTAKSD